MTTPRATRLVRVADVQAFREAAAALACEGQPLDARARLVVVPTRAAAEHLRRSIEDAAADGNRAVVVLPDFTTPGELAASLARRPRDPRPRLSGAEREAILGAACRSARQAGTASPFVLRPGLVAEILRFYDELRRRQNSVDDFERRTLGLLEPGAAIDRGAERLVKQTRFLVAAFREFEARSGAAGDDEHRLRERIIGGDAGAAHRHVVLTVADESVDPQGLTAADWDMLARAPGIERLDVVVTDAVLAGALHERMHHLLPGIEEVRFEPTTPTRLPVLLIPSRDGLVHVARDREEEVAVFAREVKAGVASGALSTPGRGALVIRQRLPYVYVARDVLRSAGIPCQLFDALPLAGEAYAAAVDLLLACVAANFARGPGVALLRSPHFALASPDDVAALDRALADAGYLGDIEALERLLDRWRQATPERGHVERALRAGESLRQCARELDGLRSPATVGEHLETLLRFLSRHESAPLRGEPDPRHLRARGAILSTLGALEAAYEQFDPEPVEFEVAAALVRRWIEGQTFSPRSGDAGAHVVDAESARFGRFEYVHVAGVVDGEWPDRPRPSVFYSSTVLRELGWPLDADRRAGQRAAFQDLLGLPERALSVSVFALEADALASPSPLVDEVGLAGLDAIEAPGVGLLVFEHEALAMEPAHLGQLEPSVRSWATRRLNAVRGRGHQGFTGPHAMPSFSLSALERYQDCPFKFFAANVLRLDETPEDELALSPRARGILVHTIFQRFLQAWDERGGGAITVGRVDEARALLEEVAAPLLDGLPPSDASLERSRLFGSAIAPGTVDVVLGLEATSPEEVAERWLEHRLEGDFGLGDASGRHVALRGVADRVDLLQGRRLRVLDYKTGRAPAPRRALQAAIYALCAQERLETRDGHPWTVDSAAYLVLSGRRSYVPVVKPGDAGGAEVLAEARQRLFAIVDGVGRGEFPPRPHDESMCDWCAYATVCRKDYA